MTQQTMAPIKPSTVQAVLPKGLLDDLRQMIDQTRESVASTVNTRLGMLYWNLGNRVRKEILKEERASMADQLSRQWRDNWLFTMVRDSLRRGCDA